MLKKFVVGLVIVLSGCAVFNGGNVPHTTLSELENSTVKPTLSYSSTALGGLTSTGKLPEATQAIIEKELLSQLNGSDYFENISKQNNTADINLDIKITNTANPAAMIPAFITGLSFYTIPSWATDNFNLVATAERKDGLKKEYVLADSTTIVQWLPMILVFPFKNFSEIPDVRINMYRKVLSDMKADGFFDSPKNPVSLAQ